MATDGQIEQCAEAWKAERWDDLASAAEGLGLALDGKLSIRLDGLLSRANGKRSSRLLTRVDLVAVLAEAAASSEGLAQRHGGLASVGKMVTTVALAVRREGKLTVGVTTTGAISGAPGRAPAWDAQLRPWRNNLADNAERCQAWAKQKVADRICLRCIEVESRVAAKPGGEAALLEAVLAAPREDDRRRVYADWAIEQGDARGELINLQCELERLKEGRAKLQERINALLQLHGAKWSAPFEKLGARVTFRRGFAEHATVRGKTFAARGAALFEAAPIVGLTLLDVSPELMRDLAANPLLARLDSLELGDHAGPSRLGSVGIAQLAKSPHVQGLRSLALPSQWLRAEGIRVLETTGFTQLEELRLFGNFLGQDGAKALAISKGLTSKLRALDLSHNGLTDAAVATIACAPNLARLTSLSFAHDGFGPAAVKALMSGTLTSLERLTFLCIRAIKDAGVRALAESPRLERITHLGLTSAGATPEGLLALIHSKHARNLQVLDLSSNQVGQEVARALLDSPSMINLRSVRCAAKGISRQTLAELTARRGREPSRG